MWPSATSNSRYARKGSLASAAARRLLRMLRSLKSAPLDRSARLGSTLDSGPGPSPCSAAQGLPNRGGLGLLPHGRRPSRSDSRARTVHNLWLCKLPQGKRQPGARALLHNKSYGECSTRQPQGLPRGSASHRGARADEGRWPRGVCLRATASLHRRALGAHSGVPARASARVGWSGLRSYLVVCSIIPARRGASVPAQRQGCCWLRGPRRFAFGPLRPEFLILGLCDLSS